MKYGELNLGQIEAMVNKLGGMDGVHLLLSDQLVLKKKVSETLVALVLLMDYDRTTLRDLITAGRYDVVNDDITEENFPAGKDEQGKKKVVFQLFHFDRVVESDYAIAEMDKDGYRPATLRELLVFGIAIPALHRQFPIIALDSVWINCLNHHYVVCLCINSLGRSLSLSLCYPSRWDGDDRFLGVRK